jgi:large subunit ribosomal protein L25
METINLHAKPREIFGKQNKTLRKTGLIPVILYGHKIKSMPLVIDKKEFDQIFNRAGQTTLIDLDVEGSDKTKVLVHDVQFDPISDEIIHVDLHQIKMTEKIKTEVPVVTIGESPAVKDLDGSLIINKDKIEIECLPQDLLHEIEVNVEGLKTFEDKICVSDLNIPKNVSVLDNPEEVVVLVNPPRSEEELAELEETVEEKVEDVEVETEKPDEEGAVEGQEEIAPENAPEQPQGEKSSEEK